MALGAITATKVRRGDMGPLFIDELSFAGDGAYPAGGTPGIQALLRAQTKDQRQLHAVMDQGGVSTHYAVYDKANDKLVVYVRATGVEVAPAASLAAVTFKLLALSV